VTRREFPIAIAVLCSAHLHAHQSDFWVTKDASQWTAQEIDRLITNSPWAKEIKVGMDGMSNGGRRGFRFPGLSGSRYLPGNGSKPASGPMPRFDAVVRWESAAPIMDALKTPLPGVLDDHYVVALCGIPPLEGSIDDVTAVTSVEVQGKSAVQAAVGSVAPGTNTQTLLFGFQKRQLAISRDDGEIVFRTQIGRAPVVARFAPKAMIYRGALAV
jgi:hypothetical protein